MNHKERMLSNLPYQAWKDGLLEERTACKQKIYRYNHLPPEEWGEQTALLWTSFCRFRNIKKSLRITCWKLPQTNTGPTNAAASSF